MNHRAITKLQNDIFGRDADSITSLELLILKRSQIFKWAAARNSLDFIRWARCVAVCELADQALLAARGNSLLLAIMALRSILEISGNAALLEKDVNELGKPIDDSFATMEWLNEFEAIVDTRASGMKVNYHYLVSEGLRESAGKVSYKPGNGEADMTAKDLLKGVDVLNKKIKGARSAYDFFCEFAHPNLASTMMHYDHIDFLLSVMDVHGYSAIHTQRKVGDEFLAAFGLVVSEGIDIVTDCVGELYNIDLLLGAKGVDVAMYARKSIRDAIKHDPRSFDFREMCPCYSGKSIQKCCGRFIKISKFGNFMKSYSANPVAIH